MCPYEEVSEYIGSLSLNLDSISNGLKSNISLIISDNLLSEIFKFDLPHVLTWKDIGF